MDRPRDELLAGAALALDQHGRVIVHDPPDQFVDLLHRQAASDDLATGGVGFDFRFGAILCRSRRGLGDSRGHQVEVGKRLGKIIVGPALHRLDGVAHRARGRDDNDCGLVMFIPRARQHFKSIHAGQNDIYERDVELTRP